MAEYRYRDVERDLTKAGVPYRMWTKDKDGVKGMVRFDKDKLVLALERVRRQSSGATSMQAWYGSIPPEDLCDVPVPVSFHRRECACKICRGEALPHSKKRRGVGPTNAHYFWHCPTVETETLADVFLPDNAVEGLTSAVKINYCVLLWTYVPVHRVPAGVVQVDAGALFDRPSAEQLLRGGANVANLADYVRALAMVQYGGVFSDVDTLWFRPLPPAFAGHSIASFEAKRDTRSKKWDEEWSLIKYLRTPSDHLFIATPVRAPRGSPWTMLIVLGLEKQFNLRGGIDPLDDAFRGIDPSPFIALVPKNRNRDVFNRVILHQATIFCGLQEATLPAEACSPLPYTAKKVHTLPLKEIKWGVAVPFTLDNSFCANGYWSTTKLAQDLDQTTALSLGSLSTCRADSAWCQCRRYAFGPEFPIPLLTGRRMRTKGGRTTEALPQAVAEASPPDPAVLGDETVRHQYDCLCKFRFKMLKKVYGTTAAYVAMAWALKNMAQRSQKYGPAQSESEQGLRLRFSAEQAVIAEGYDVGDARGRPLEICKPAWVERWERLLSDDLATEDSQDTDASAITELY